MKSETIPGSTDATGLFTAKSPYQALDYEKGGTYEAKIKAFEILYPPLFCYNENNQLVKRVDGLEVKGPVWQNEHPINGQWVTVSAPNYEYATRQVYIAVQPTEKSALPISKGSYTINIYNKIDNKTVDILQDIDKIVLTHKQAIELANEILSKINHVKTN